MQHAVRLCTSHKAGQGRCACFACPVTASSLDSCPAEQGLLLTSKQLFLWGTCICIKEDSLGSTAITVAATISCTCRAATWMLSGLHVQAAILPFKLSFYQHMTGPRHSCWILLLLQNLTSKLTAGPDQSQPPARRRAHSHQMLQHVTACTPCLPPAAMHQLLTCCQTLSQGTLCSARWARRAVKLHFDAWPPACVLCPGW